jgi:hypothetical protein
MMIMKSWKSRRACTSNFGREDKGRFEKILGHKEHNSSGTLLRMRLPNIRLGKQHLFNMKKVTANT